MGKRESSLQRSVLEYLDSIPGGFVFNVHGSPYQKRGMPDILFWFLSCSYAFELKRDGKQKPSRSQDIQMAKLRKAGVMCRLVDNLDQVKKVINV